MAIRRTYATESEEENSREAAESGEQTSSISDVVEDAQEKLEDARDSVTESVSSAADAVTPDTPASSAQPTPIRTESGRATAAETANKNLYIGNLFFEVSEDQLRQEFARFGAIETVKIVYDGRGLSKGFGYVEFQEPESAEEARNALNGQVYEGRRMTVQFAIKSRPAGGARDQQVGFRNGPSRTLFIGNMSYEMSDKDLNDLFRQIKNVLDVRVAIDRRTGQPRGFAHADFVDTPSAEEAAEFLKNKEFYSRRLRVDFSTTNRGS